MLIAVYPVIVLILGLLLWALATVPPKAIAAEAGRLMFFAALLVLLFALARVVVHLG